MEKKRVLAALGIITMLALTGVGCKDLGKKSSSNDSSYSDSKDSNKKVANVEIEGNENTDDLQGIIEGVFGDVKVTSFLQNFPTPNSLSAEFQTKQEITSGDLNKLTAALKKKGYTIEFSGMADGMATATANDKTNYIMIAFEVGSSKVGGWISPKEEIDKFNEEE